MLRGNGRGAEHEAGDHHSCQGVGARRRSVCVTPLRRHGVFGGASQRAFEVDEHVQAEKQEPDHGGRAVKPARDLERVPVQESHRDAAAEQDDCRCDEQRREQAHRDLRRPLDHVRTATQVVARESPTGTPQLQEHRRDQGKPDEHVQRHEGVHAEQDRCQLNEDRNQQK